jgi:N,N'-diacetyllegionaminate synthase
MKLIAETATHHQGDETFMESLVKTIVNQTKADIVKFHIMLDINEYFHFDHEGYEMAKNWVFSKALWTKFINIVKSKDKELMLLFNDTKAVEFGMSFDPTLVEIHSVCLNDLKLLQALKLQLRPETKIVLGIGGTSLNEIENAIKFLDHSNIVLMFGFQNYPTKLEDINFRKIKKIMSLYPKYEFGYADHTAWDHPHNEMITLFGAAQGMQYIEKHVTTHYGKERIDWSAAISTDKFNKIKDGIDLLENCNGTGLLAMNQGEKSYSVYGPMKKTGILNKSVKKSEKIRREDLDFKRTSQISDLSQLDIWNAIDLHYACDLGKGKVLKSKHIIK